MTLGDFGQVLAERREEFARLHALVDGAALCDELLNALARVHLPEEPLLTLADAARQTGYSADHLGRLVRKGTLYNYGRRGRPLVRLSECPQRAIASPVQPTRVIADHIVVRSTAQ